LKPKGYFQPCPHPNESAGPKPRLLIIPPACHENQRLRQIACLNIDRHYAARGSAPVDSMSSIPDQGLQLLGDRDHLDMVDRSDNAGWIHDRDFNAAVTMLLNNHVKQ